MSCVCKVTLCQCQALLWAITIRNCCVIYIMVGWVSYNTWCCYVDNSYNIVSSQVQNHHLLFESWHFLLLLRKLLLLLAVSKYYLSITLVHWPTPILSYTMCLIVGHRFIFLQPAEESAMSIVIAGLYNLLAIGRNDTNMAGRNATIVIKKWSTTKWSRHGIQCAATFLILWHSNFCVLGS